jgi:hypothetical protein
MRRREFVAHAAWALLSTLPLAPAAHAQYRIDAFDLAAMPSNGQVRGDRLAPILATIHNSGARTGMIEVECAIGALVARANVDARRAAMTERIRVELPAGLEVARAPRGPHRVSCLARAPSGPVAARTSAELTLEAPSLPDYVVEHAENHPRPAFDCANQAPPVATRSACVALHVHDPNRAASEDRATQSCSVDGRAITTELPFYHQGPFDIGALSAGRHVLRCTTRAPFPRYEANGANNTFELAFEVGDGSRWHYDLAVTAIDRAARVEMVRGPTPPGPPRDTPAEHVTGLRFGVHVRNAGPMRVLAVMVSCRARRAERTIEFEGSWANRDWLRGLDPGEAATVDVEAPVSIGAGALDTVCTARGAPADVPDRELANNQRSGRVAVPR